MVALAISHPDVSDIVPRPSSDTSDFHKVSSGTAHSDILLSSPPLRMCLPSMEKVAQYNGLECLNMAMDCRSQSHQRRTQLSSDAEATRVPAGFTTMAL